jgi:hypothetical protein
VVHMTRNLAGIRITVRKDPEVLLTNMRETHCGEWVLLRMYFLLHQVKEEGVRTEVVSSIAGIFRVWKEGVPKSWHQLRKSTESVKTFVASLVAVSLY